MVARSIPPVILYVLGAPGAGKSTLVPHLRAHLPTHIVIDWDAFTEPAGDLATSNIRADARTWAAYRALVRSIVETVEDFDVVVLGPCTPGELVAGHPGDGSFSTARTKSEGHDSLVATWRTTRLTPSRTHEVTAHWACVFSTPPTRTR